MILDGLEEGDIVEYDWGSETIQGIFLRVERRGPNEILCAIIETDKRGIVPVHLTMVRQVL